MLFLKRPGGQAQFSAQLAAQTADRAPLRELQAWIADHLDEDLSVPALAARAHMSERNFARAFARETGMTPAAYVEAARVESARIALETGRRCRSRRVARQAGFGTVETMRRAFRRRVGVSPADYRRRFSRRRREYEEARRMKIAIPLYDRFTALDAVGPYEVLSRLPGASVTWLAHEPGVVRTDNGMLGIERRRGFRGPAGPGDRGRARWHRHGRVARRRAPGWLDPQRARDV